MSGAKRRTTAPLDEQRSAVLYARFSPRPDADECDSCDRQIADLEEYAERRGLLIRGRYRDEAISGGEADRPGLQKAINRLARGDVLLVRSWDRLYRDVRLSAALDFELARRGCTILTLREADDGVPAEIRVLIRSVFQGVAEYQRRSTSVATRKAMRRHQANGRIVGGNPPYGWRRSQENGRKMVPVASEQRVLRAMVIEQRLTRRLTSLGAMGRETSSYEIAAALRAQRLRCRTAFWTAQSVRRTLDRIEAWEELGYPCIREYTPQELAAK